MTVPVVPPYELNRISEWVQDLDIERIVGVARPRAARDLFKRRDKGGTDSTYYTLYKQWLTHEVPNLIANDDEWEWVVNTVIAGGVTKVRKDQETFRRQKGYALWKVQSAEGMYPQFYTMIGELKEWLKTDAAAASRVKATHLVTHTAAGEGLEGPLGWVKSSALLAHSKVALEKVIATYNRYGAAADEKAFTQKDARKAMALIADPLGLYRTAEMDLREAIGRAQGNDNPSDDDVKAVQEAVTEFLTSCEELLRGLRNAADSCWSWAKRSTAKKIREGFQDQQPLVWASLKAGKIAVGAVATAISLGFPPAAPAGAALSIAAIFVEKAVVMKVAADAADDIDKVMKLLDQQYKTPLGEKFEMLMEGVEGATMTAEVMAAAVKAAKAAGEAVPGALGTAGTVIAPVALAIEIGMVAVEVANKPRLRPLFGDDAESRRKVALLKDTVMRAYEQFDFKQASQDHGTFRKIQIGDLDSGGYRVTIGDMTGVIDAESGRFTPTNRVAVFRLAVSRAQRNGAIPVRVKEGGTLKDTGERISLSSTGWDALRDTPMSGFKDEGSAGFLVEEFLNGGNTFHARIHADGGMSLARIPQEATPGGATVDVDALYSWAVRESITSMPEVFFPGDDVTGWGQPIAVDMSGDRPFDLQGGAIAAPDGTVSWQVRVGLKWSESGGGDYTPVLATCVVGPDSAGDWSHPYLLIEPAVAETLNEAALTQPPNPVTTLERPSSWVHDPDRIAQARIYFVTGGQPISADDEVRNVQIYGDAFESPTPRTDFEPGALAWDVWAWLIEDGSPGEPVAAFGTYVVAPISVEDDEWWSYFDVDLTHPDNADLVEKLQGGGEEQESPG